MLPRLRHFSLLVMMSLPLLAAERAPDTGVCYVLRVFTVPKGEGLELLARNLDDEPLYRHLMNEAKTRPAVLEKLMLVTSTGSQDKVEVQQGVDVLCPTEFDPPQIPQALAIGDPAAIMAAESFFQATEPKPAPTPEPPKPDPAPKPPPDSGSHPAPLPEGRGGEGRQDAGKEARHPVNQGFGIITPMVPTAYQTYLAGDKLTLETSVAPVDGNVTLKASLEMSRLAGVHFYNGEPQVEFSKRTLVTMLPLVIGPPSFLGTCSTAQCTGDAFEDRGETVSFAFLSARKPAPGSSSDPVLEDGLPLQPLLEVFSLPRQQASVLVEEAANDAAFHQRLKAAVKSGEGRLEACLTGRVPSGMDAVVSEVNDYLYPVEFGPPQVPQNVFLSDEDLLADLRAGRQVGTGVAAPAAGPHNAGFGLLTATSPNAFQTRELGVKLNLEVLQDDRNLTIQARPQLTRLLGERDYVGTSMPVFESDFLSTTTRARLDVPCLLGTLSRPTRTGLKEESQEDRVWFGFVTVRAVE